MPKKTNEETSQAPIEETKTEAAPHDAPAPIRLGSALVSLLEPAKGREVELHRWYERDHFYSGCMVGPHFFAGRRFVATRALKDLRIPARDAFFPDVREGSYLTLYWLLAGHHEEAERWAVDRIQSLIANDRMMSGRRATHGGFYHSRLTVRAESDGVPPELALDHPFGGVGMTVIDAPSSEALPELLAALEERLLPESIARSGAALCIGFIPSRLPEDAPAYVERPEGVDRRVLILDFFSGDPGAALRRGAENLAAATEAQGFGKLRLAAAFLPTIPGTDRYTDELW